MNDAQVWTLIGLFAAGLASVIGLTLRVVSAEIRGLRHEMVARFEAVDARFEAVDARFEHLDRDIQALARKVFPEA